MAVKQYTMHAHVVHSFIYFYIGNRVLIQLTVKARFGRISIITQTAQVPAYLINALLKKKYITCENY